MSAAEAVSSARESGAAMAILVGGLVCGVMDITAAFIVYGSFGLTPVPALQGIAAGLLGPRAHQGGLTTAALGLACHFVIAFWAASAFVVVSRWWGFLIDHYIISGILYGPIVYFFMQLVVLPLSAAGKSTFSVKFMVIGLVIHIVCVGLPIAIATRKFSVS
jgi:hypothetical protein